MHCKAGYFWTMRIVSMRRNKELHKITVNTKIFTELSWYHGAVVLCLTICWKWLGVSFLLSWLFWRGEYVTHQGSRVWRGSSALWRGENLTHRGSRALRRSSAFFFSAMSSAVASSTCSAKFKTCFSVLIINFSISPVCASPLQSQQ